ncbi:MAG TPA: NAD(P)-dependent oxidoreductase [Stellaceae bacterium]|nr:NAD(P)-dependent oxidoreductase [Stellaceae bacterium]
MRVLLSGASSFTGYWFARALAEAGHDVTAALSSPDAAGYSGIRAERVRRLRAVARTVFAAPMGSEALFAAIREAPFDVFCHHWAEARNYRSPDYDVLAAVGAATNRFVDVLRALAERGCSHLVLTGTFSEEEEGAGERPLRSFNPYSLAKSLTWRYVRYYCEREGMGLGKVVLPNPFGPYEEPRFTDYLMRSWYRGERARVMTPRYVRDNIHVDLLAKAYAAYVGSCRGPGAAPHLSPSGYPEAQGAFARRVAAAMTARLGLDCALELVDQREFAEPVIRIGTDIPDAAALGWSEEAAWDGFAEYYRARYAGGR